MDDNRKLLFRYLSMALPYDVVCFSWGDGNRKLSGIYNGMVHFESLDRGDDDGLRVMNPDWIKPYLIPMEDMTEEEKREIYNWLVENDVDWFDFSKLRLDEILISFDSSWLLVNWLLKKHYDFMGLIKNNLAIKVTKENNPYNEKEHEGQ